MLSIIITSVSIKIINTKNELIQKQSIEIEESNNDIIYYTNLISSQKNQLSALQSQLQIEKNTNKHLKYLGKFKITYYDLGYESCGKYSSDPAYGITYSGAVATANITVAVDTNIIPLGSYLYIEGTGCRIAQDIGGAVKGNHIDVFVNDFSYEKYHTHYTDVYLIQ